MEHCPYCASPVPSGAARCPACGSSLFAPAHNLAQGTRLKGGQYTLGKVLGQGGFGITYLGADTRRQQPVAIKELFPEGAVRRASRVIPPTSLAGNGFLETMKRFEDEARLLARFNHPGIVKVFDVFEENGTAYLVMEFLRGQTLGKRLEQVGKLPAGEVQAIAVKLADALEVVHKAGLLHRDIKPDNVFLTEEGRVVLIDFGSARQFARGKTITHTRLVTPGYAPLEQYGSAGKFGPYTDLYALGATLYHALTGAPPPAATDRIQSNLAIRLPPATPDGLADDAQRNTRLEQAVNKALEIRVDERPQSVAEFRALLLGRSRPAPAPNTGSLVVQVTPREATVELQGPGLRRVFQGDQSFGSVPAGQYRLSAQAPGFQPRSVTVEVKPAQQIRVSLDLTPVAPPPNPGPQPHPSPNPTPQPSPFPTPTPTPDRRTARFTRPLLILLNLVAMALLGYLVFAVQPVSLEPLLAPADTVLRQWYGTHFPLYLEPFPWIRAGLYALVGVLAFQALAFLATWRGWWVVGLLVLIGIMALVDNELLPFQEGVFIGVGVVAAYTGVYLLERFMLPLAAILGLIAAVRWANPPEILEPRAFALAILVVCLGGIVRLTRRLWKGA